MFLSRSATPKITILLCPASWVAVGGSGASVNGWGTVDWCSTIIAVGIFSSS